MNAPTTAVAERPASRELTPLDGLKHQMNRKRDEFAASLPAHISFEKFQRTIATAALSNPQLLQCDRQSLLVSASKAAQDGLLPDGRESALVPFKVNKKDGAGNWQTYWAVQYMPMVYGLRKKILQSGEVVSLEVGVVYKAEVEAGHFLYEIGMEPPIRHRPKLDMTDEEMQDENIVAAYSIARLKNPNGEPYVSVELMRRAEINKVRETSQTGALFDKKGKPRAPSGPWVDWFGEMAKKTVLRRHSKVLPMSGDILDAIEREDEDLAAAGTARLLEVEPEAPVALPTAAELDALSGHDPETGEVIDQPEPEPERNPATGMTEVDEETARALDAGEQDDWFEDAERSCEIDPADAKFSEIEHMVDAATDLAGVRAAKDEWARHSKAYPPARVKAMDEKIHRKAMNVPERSQGGGK